jgi:hypothetical protein
MSLKGELDLIMKIGILLMLLATMVFGIYSMNIKLNKLIELNTPDKPSIELLEIM